MKTRKLEVPFTIVTEKDGLCRYGIWRWPDTCDLDGVQIMRVR